ncbi:thioredoxin family protein [Halorubrum vacuolatum]|uniref:Thioredoxin 1 n=1 Tax=Halorubrum vacuolatum TaxID=63740 RepID=A0A238UW34_HALVU|nr:thioredoxin family protein [Halorubrum vacuolatum]SNR25947.1 thioredoxin 1 [Halorubrum vacuolatum]
MSEGSTDDPDAERQRIRERKLQELQERLEAGELGADGGATAGGDATSGVEDAGAGRTAPTEPIEITGETQLQETIDAYDVVLVDCYAEWCGPCQMMKPAIEAVAADTPAAVATVDIDRNRGVAAALGARSVPTLVLYANGQPVERLVGAQDRATLERLIGEYG